MISTTGKEHKNSDFRFLEKVSVFKKFGGKAKKTTENILENGKLRSIKDSGDEINSLLKSHKNLLLSQILKSEEDDDDMKIRSNPIEMTDSDLKVKPRILIVFGQHGRELISSETSLAFLKAVCKGDSNSNQLFSSKDKNILLSDIELKIIPNSNPTGRRQVEKGKLCLRMNSAGVDLNRNYPLGWKEGTAEDTEFQTFPGSKPLSEPESQALIRVVDEFKPHAFLDVHSGMKGLLQPYGFMKKSTGKFNTILTKINAKIKKHFCSECKQGNSVDVVGYESHGCALDYLFLEKSVPISTAWEIYGENDRKFKMDKFRFMKSSSKLTTEYSNKMQSELVYSGSENECFGYFNPQTFDDYKETTSNWAKAIAVFAMSIKNEKIQRLKKELEFYKSKFQN